MSLRIGGARLVRRAVGRLEGPIVELPAFLCPALIRSARSPYYQQRNLHSTQTSAPIKPLSVVGPPNRLPQQCSGCGALSQTVDESEPGFFDLKRKSVKLYLSGVSGTTSSEEDATFNRSLELAKENDPQFAEKFGFSFSPRRESKRS
jgi:hypothetical protein